MRSSINTKASVIVVIGESKQMIRLVYCHRPKCEVIAVTRDIQKARQLNIFDGVTPLVYEKTSENLSRIDFAINFAKRRGIVKCGDSIVVLKSDENLMEVHYISYNIQ